MAWVDCESVVSHGWGTGYRCSSQLYGLCKAELRSVGTGSVSFIFFFGRQRCHLSFHVTMAFIFRAREPELRCRIWEDAFVASTICFAGSVSRFLLPQIRSPHTRCARLIVLCLFVCFSMVNEIKRRPSISRGSEPVPMISIS